VTIDNVLAGVLEAFAATVTGDFSAEDVLRRLAEAAVQVLAVDGAGVMLPVGDELLRFVFATGPMLQQVGTVERLQEQLQAGPCRDSRVDQRTIDIADLATDGDWPTYQRAAVAGGLHGVTVVPLIARGRTWGVLDLYRATVRTLDEGELAAARTLAHLATSYLVVAEDRDSARAAREELAHRAMHDPLTDLPVRWVYLEQLTHALARLERHPGDVAVLFVDLDGLKYVNDTWGHRAGDELILTCVHRIRAALRPTDTVARLGGDEFVVLLEEVDLAGACRVASQRENLTATLRPWASSGGGSSRPPAGSSRSGTACWASARRAGCSSTRACRS
jgi:diguanylate cyclase (GGDEF)-like protein